MVVRDWTLPLDEEDRARLGATRQRFTDACSQLAGETVSVDALFEAMARLAAITTGDLPPKAQLLWQEHVARPLKGDPSKPLPDRAVASIRSWPTSRAADLAKALADIEAALVEAENDALHEAIYVEISRAYS